MNYKNSNHILLRIDIIMKMYLMVEEVEADAEIIMMMTATPVIAQDQDLPLMIVVEDVVYHAPLHDHPQEEEIIPPTTMVTVEPILLLPVTLLLLLK